MGSGSQIRVEHRDYAQLECPSLCRDQRIAHSDFPEAAEVAISGPQLADAVLQAQGSNSGVMHHWQEPQRRQAPL